MSWRPGPDHLRVVSISFGYIQHQQDSITQHSLQKAVNDRFQDWSIAAL